MYMIPPVTDHKEPSPEEVNKYRALAVDHIRENGIDEGVTTCVVLTLYDNKGRKWQELRGTTNPGLKRFRAVLASDGSGECTSFESRRSLKWFDWSFRPPYDEKLAKRRSKE